MVYFWASFRPINLRIGYLLSFSRQFCQDHLSLEWSSRCHALGRMRLAQNAAYGIARDQQFFIGGDHISL